MTESPPRTFTLDELGEMAKIAQAVETKGDWQLNESPYHLWIEGDDGQVANVELPNDAYHIARFDPPTALALIAQLQAAMKYIANGDAFGKAVSESLDDERVQQKLELRALRAELATTKDESERLRKALKCFAHLAKGEVFERLPDSHIFELVWASDAQPRLNEDGEREPIITAGQLRRALAALAKAEKRE